MVGLVLFGGVGERAFSQTSTFCSNSSDCGQNCQCRVGLCFVTVPPDKAGTGAIASFSAPEPGTLLLVLSGFAGLVAWRKTKPG